MDEKRMPTAEELTDILSRFGLTAAKLRQFKAEEDGYPYSVWHVQAGTEDYVLKRAKGLETEVYRSFFPTKKPYAPALIDTAAYQNDRYLLLEYCPGDDLRRCDRERLILALDALGAMQDEFWAREELYDAACTLEKSIKAIEDRGHWLGSERLETVYEKFIRVYRQTQRSLCHDDLLPFNVLVGERAVLIDWEYGGVLPYPGPLARLIAHGREDENAFFHMKRADREFAIDYYYRICAEKHGISYEEYRRTLDFFLFYEACEWIMLGNRYDQRGDERYAYSLRQAEALADRLL